MNMYQEPPNQVAVKLSDDSGEAMRWIIGKSLDETIATVEAAFGAVPTAAKSKKARKPRRTKAQMNAVADSVAAAEGQSAPSSRKNGKKELAGTPWPG